MYGLKKQNNNTNQKLKQQYDQKDDPVRNSGNKSRAISKFLPRQIAELLDIRKRKVSKEYQFEIKFYK